MKLPTILVVDDDRNFLRVLSYQIEEFGFRSLPASSAAGALKLLEEQKIHLAITDLKMPGMDGLQLLQQIRKLNPDLPVIVLTAYGTIDRAVEAIKKGASDFLTKPFEKEVLRHTILKAFQMSDLLQENRRLSQAVSGKFEFDGLTGTSKEFKAVLEMARQLSSVESTVLIQGESGTGKELIARAIHFNGIRRTKPLVVVNCGALPRDLIESELFGYKKGAFTGAITNKKGKFESADSGTLFLDEIGELPFAMQVKLLRVLQEGEIDILGDPTPHPVDVRIIAATNREIPMLMAEGTFREDLYYRLCVAPLTLPPLRRRPEDIPLLALHFLEKLNQKLRKHVIFEGSVLEAFQKYHWPGNVRELENMVERMVIFNHDGIVTREDLPSQFKKSTFPLSGFAIQLPEDDFSLEEAERDIIIAALERHNWNQTRAARYLGMTRNTLIYRMQKYRIKERRRGSTSDETGMAKTD
jgi:DNA-binding NtrC family response regulator